MKSKILVFTTIYPIKGTKNGFTPIVKYFCEDWVKQGHDVYVINSSSRFPFFFYLFPNFLLRFIESKLGFNLPNFFSRREIITKEDGVKIYQLPINKFFPGSLPSDAIINKNLLKIEQNFLEGFKPDVCVGHWISPQIQYLSYFKKKFILKTVLTLHSVPNDKEVKLLNKYIDDIDNIGFRSKKLIEPTLNKISKKITNTFLCHSGVKDFYNLSNIEFTPKTRKNIKIKICFIGNLISRKYPEILLEAANQIFNASFEIHYIGDGYLDNYLKNMSKGKHIDVIFHGRIERKDVYRILEECELFVMLSKNETFGLVYLEAMLNKVIPIASLDEGFDGIIEHKINGFLGNAGSVSDLVTILKDYIRLDRDEILKIQYNAFQTAKLMTDEKMAINYLNNIKCKP